MRLGRDHATASGKHPKPAVECVEHKGIELGQQRDEMLTNGEQAGSVACIQPTLPVWGVQVIDSELVPSTPLYDC